MGPDDPAVTWSGTAGDEASAQAGTEVGNDMSDADATDDDAMSMRAFRESFYYGEHADMQYKFLAKMSDTDAADLLAGILHDVGGALDTGDLTTLHDRIQQAQAATYADDPTPQVDDAPFTPMTRQLGDTRLMLLSAGGVFRRDDDPMGPDGPSQTEALGMIKEFLRGSPTLSAIPTETPNAELTARHPGYDATTAQRDPGTVFPLAVLRDIANEGRVQLAQTHYAFTGATSQSRLKKEVADAWARRFVAEEVDGCLLVAT